MSQRIKKVSAGYGPQTAPNDFHIGFSNQSLFIFYVFLTANYCLLTIQNSKNDEQLQKENAGCVPTHDNELILLLS